MGQINIYKIEKSEECIQSLEEKLEKKTTLNKVIQDGENNKEYNVTLFVSEGGNEKVVSWNWILTEFGEQAMRIVSSPNCVVLIIEDVNMYAITFGHAYFIVDKFCDKNFAFKFARKLHYKEIKTTTLTSPNSQRNKTVNMYLNYSDLEFDSGESFVKIKAKVKLDEGFNLHNENIEIGNSIKFNIEDESIDRLLKLVCYIERKLEEDDIIKIPVFQKVREQETIDTLNRNLITSINEQHCDISFSEMDIIGASEIFNHNDTTFKLKYRQKEKDVTELTNEVMRAFLEECDIEIEDALTKVKIVAYMNGTSVKTNKLFEVIDYIDDENKSVLLKGTWYTYNDDYLEYLEASLDEIETIYNPNYDFHKENHRLYIERKYSEEKTKDEYIGLADTDIKKKIEKKYYAERYYNLMLEEEYGFQNYDRGLNVIGEGTIELMDLYKDNTMFAVKKGNSSGKLCYVIDQSLTSLQIYKHNLLDEKPILEAVGIWLVLERRTKLWEAGEKPSINKLEMLSLKNKIDYWKKEVRLQGYKPIIYINYVIE